MSRFRDQVTMMDEMAKHFIDSSFQKLRSTEGAFVLLQKVEKSSTRESIYNQLILKFNDILGQCGKDINSIEELFHASKSSPPLGNGEMPVAGSIRWCRDLFQRAKISINRFRSFPDVLKSELGKSVAQRFIALAKTMSTFEAAVFAEWSEHASDVTSRSLKMSIICEELTTTKYTVNFSATLAIVIKEAIRMDKFGLKLPLIVRCAALQDEKFTVFQRQLYLMLDNYYSFLNDIQPYEEQLMKQQTSQLKRIIAPAFSRLTWSSLNIEEFITHSNAEIHKAQVLFAQIRTTSHEVEVVVRSIAQTNLVKHMSTKDAIPDAQVYLHFMYRLTNSYFSKTLVDFARLLQMQSVPSIVE